MATINIHNLSTKATSYIYQSPIIETYNITSDIHHLSIIVTCIIYHLSIIVTANIYHLSTIVTSNIHRTVLWSIGRWYLSLQCGKFENRLKVIITVDGEKYVWLQWDSFKQFLSILERFTIENLRDLQKIL